MPSTDDTPPAGTAAKPAPPHRQARARRLEQQLRANLQRRKQKSRALECSPGDHEEPAGAADDDATGN